MYREDEFKQQPLRPQTYKPATAEGSDVSIKRDINIESACAPLEEKPDGDPGPEVIQTELDSALLWLEDEMPSMVKHELRKYRKTLRTGSPEIRQKDENEGQRRVKDSILNLTASILRETKGEELADSLLSVFSGPPDKVCCHKLKSKLQRKFTCVFEGIAKAGKPVHLNDIYTELYITEGGASGWDNEHDVIQIEATTRNRAEETIMCQDIFKRSADRDQPIRTEQTERQGPIKTVLTKGVAGIGKTVLTQKFSLDWAEGRANQDIQLLFPFTFRELNLLRERSISLVQLIHHFFPETKKAGISHFEEFQTVLIFDGLDEFQIPLNFNSKALLDASESTTVDILLVNLIRRDLLPSACLWITTRPAAANQIPVKYVDMVTEVRGFTDPQKKKYFQKRFRTKKEATAIISHIQLSRSLHIMCSIPVFCWITATVLENIMKTQQEVLLPKTLTEMYIHFLIVQVKMKNVKYDGKAEMDPHWSRGSKNMIECLAKLAFEQLQKGNLIFYESDLIQCGIDFEAAAVDSGVFTQIFREERGLYELKVYCFIHLSVQEFLAALHVHLTFSETGVNLFSPHESSETHFYETAVDQALQSPNGHLDLFLRFLLGLSLPSNQNLLRGFLRQSKGSSETRDQIIDYIKTQVTKSSTTESSINLFHCLSELNDRSLVEHIQQLMNSGSLDAQKLSPAQWSALAYILLSSNKDLEVFELRRYSASEEVLLRLLPVVKVSSKAVLSVSSLSERSCSSLSTVLSCPSTCLKELDLSNNVLKDPRVELLFEGLKTSSCPLEVLCLCNCGLSDKSCEVLASVLTSPSSSLVQLDLTNNDLKDSGVKLLCDGLKSPECKLEKLGLSGCLVTEEGSSSLVSVLNSSPLHLKILDLSYNHLSETVKKLLLAQVEDRGCRLDTLRLEPSGARWMKPGLKKYTCHLKLDPTTVYKKLRISASLKSVTCVEEEQSYPDHPDRFDECPQVLCSQSLSGRCYWEFEWSGWGDVSVCYRGIRRKGASDDCVFGLNSQSWSLCCSDRPGSISHNKSGTPLPLSAVSSSSRVAVYVDCPGGSVSFYTVSGEELVLLHKLNTTFTEPLLTGFGFWSSNSSATLCDM